MNLIKLTMKLLDEKYSVCRLDKNNLIAQSQISIFALSTYDTDYILINRNNIEASICALTSNNYAVIK